MARILFTTFGSYGDLHPYMAVGVELKNRGHGVTIATSPTYQAKVESGGLAFHPVRPDVSLENRALLEAIFDAHKGTERVVRYLASVINETFADTLEAARRIDLVVTHPLTFGAVAAAQKLGLPWVSSVLAPASLLSAYDPPVVAPAPWLVKLRVFGAGPFRLLWKLARRQTLDWMMPVIDLRRELRLDTSRHPLFEGANSPLKVLALFSPDLAKPQPDWPPNVVVTGFPFLHHHEEQAQLSPELTDFLSEGAAPFVFTLGSSAVGAAGNFYRDSLDAVERLGARAILLTGTHPQGLPEHPPRGVLVVPYAPHSQIFPRAAAIVHQGGIGTLAEALRSGRPMLVVPFAHDQFDNAARARRLGVGEVVYRTRYSARTSAAGLRRILENPEYANVSAVFGGRVRQERGTEAAANALETCLG